MSTTRNVILMDLRFKVRCALNDLRTDTYMQTRDVNSDMYVQAIIAMPVLKGYDESMKHCWSHFPLRILHKLEFCRTWISRVEIMTAEDDYFDDDGFINYVPTTVDPDYILLVATTLFCIFSNAILPCLVTLGKRYEKRKIAREASQHRDESMDAASEQPQAATTTKETTHGFDLSRKSEGDQNLDSHGGGSHSKGSLTGADSHAHTWKSLLDQVRFITNHISFKLFCLIIPGNHNPCNDPVILTWFCVSRKRS